VDATETLIVEVTAVVPLSVTDAGDTVQLTYFAGEAHVRLAVLVVPEPGGVSVMVSVAAEPPIFAVKLVGDKLDANGATTVTVCVLVVAVA
jgi:hypothetical protein